MDWEAVSFDSSALVAGLFLLQYGADNFIENSAIILEEVGVSPTLAHLVTAGAEWEELAIVVASIFQNQAEIGLGNIIGSSVGNILGGLAVAMIIYPGTMKFDSCARFYGGASFISSSVFLLIHYTDGMDFTGGLFYMVFFAVYIFAVGLAIYEGYLTMPVVEEDDRIMIEDTSISRQDTVHSQTNNEVDIEIYVEPPADSAAELQISVMTAHEIRPSVDTPLLGRFQTPTSILNSDSHLVVSRRSTLGPLRAHTFRSLRTLRSTNSGERLHLRTVVFYTIKMVLGFLTIAVSGFVLSYSSANLAEAFNISGMVFGLTILSIFSTLPEKFISIIAGLEGDSSLLVASIAGSNVFLLTLCLGILLGAGGEGDADSILASHMLPFEVWCTWGCALLLLVIVWFGGSRWIGVLLFIFYIAFNALELTVYRR